MAGLSRVSTGRSWGWRCRTPPAEGAQAQEKKKKHSLWRSAHSVLAACSGDFFSGGIFGARLKFMEQLFFGACVISLMLPCRLSMRQASAQSCRLTALLYPMYVCTAELREGQRGPKTRPASSRHKPGWHRGHSSTRPLSVVAQADNAPCHAPTHSKRPKKDDPRCTLTRIDRVGSMIGSHRSAGFQKQVSVRQSYVRRLGSE